MFPYNNSPDYLRLVQVDGAAQIPQVSVNPMERILVVCRNEPVFAFVSANGFGQPLTKYYKMQTFNPAQQNENVSRSEFSAMQEQLNQLIQLVTQKGETKEAVKNEPAV